MDKICLFDVNGTLLDLSSLDSFFEQIFGRPEVRQLWMRTVLHTSVVLNANKNFGTFDFIAEETLISFAREYEINLTLPQRADFKERLNELPVFPDVAAGLRRLRASGYRLAALTNSSEKSARTNLARGKVESEFEAIFSVDSVKIFKPAATPYLFAAKTLRVAPEDLWMVAGHAWDTAGAQRAGLKAALILRPEHGMNKCFPPPGVEGEDLLDVAQKMVDLDRPFFERMMQH